MVTPCYKSNDETRSRASAHEHGRTSPLNDKNLPSSWYVEEMPTSLSFSAFPGPIPGTDVTETSNSDVMNDAMVSSDVRVALGLYAAADMVLWGQRWVTVGCQFEFCGCMSAADEALLAWVRYSFADISMAYAVILQKMPCCAVECKPARCWLRWRAGS